MALVDSTASLTMIVAKAMSISFTLATRCARAPARPAQREEASDIQRSNFHALAGAVPRPPATLFPPDAQSGELKAGSISNSPGQQLRAVGSSAADQDAVVTVS
jgi:hypothetical protein